MSKKVQAASKKVQIVAIDLGNFNVKTSNKEIFRATWSLKADKLKEQIARETLKTIEYEGKKYYIGEGDFDTHSEKSTKDTLPLFLYALSRMVKTNVSEVKAVIGLPINQLDKKESLIKRFTGTFTFTADGTIRTVNVSEIRVFPECVGANYSIPDSIPLDYILLDLGGLSANKALFHDGEYAGAATEPTGVLNLIEEMANAINADHGTKLNTAQMYQKLKDNRLWTPKSGDVNLDEYRETYFMPYVKDVMDSLEALEGLNTPIYILGGAAEMLRPWIEKYLKQNPNRYAVTFLEDGIYYNVLGFKKVGELTWQK